jgi:putative methanogenesis marker protein 8
MALPVDRDDEHIIEAIGRCRIVVRSGRVVEVGEPLIRDCPLARRFAIPVKDLTPEAIRTNIEGRITAFGMCTPHRVLEEEKEFVAFGASELLSTAVRCRSIDCAVVACDGAGTVLATTPALVQGIGGRMSGLVRTAPIPEVIRGIIARGGHVLDTAYARIDQHGGVALAADLGFRSIAVTVTDPAVSMRIRTDFPGTLIFGVHTTALSRSQAEQLVQSADLVTACASRHVREAAQPIALVQAGTAIPIYALTAAGKALILTQLQEARQPILVKVGPLPREAGGAPNPLV